MFIELKTADTQGAFKKVNRAEWHLMARGMEVLFMKVTYPKKKRSYS
jgi:hypothetical protein